MARLYDVSVPKKKPIREAYADRWVRERCQIGIKQVRRSLVALTTYFFFAFLDFFAAFFFAGISESPPLGHALFVI